MKLNRFPLVVSALVLSLAQVTMAAPACSVKMKVPASTRVFARAGVQGAWQEYSNIEAVPDLALGGGISAQFWREGKKRASVYVVEPGQDFWAYTRYCFDKDGQLQGMGYSIVTPLGWGIRTTSFLSVGAINSASSEFFETKSGRVIAKPAGVGRFPVEMRPPLYLAVSDLPFAPLLEGKKKESPKSKPAPKMSAMAAMRLR